MGKLRDLCTPTQKVSIDGDSTGLGFPSSMDHYKCYNVDSSDFQPREVGLHDEFDEVGEIGEYYTFRVEKPALFCNPTEKTVSHLGRINLHRQFLFPTERMVCYRISEAEVTGLSENETHLLAIRNQFGAQMLLTLHAKLFCIPGSVINPD